jgi:hypothetical protein
MTGVMTMSDGPRIVFDEGTTETMIEVFGWETNDDGIIVDGDGTPAPVFNDNGPLAPDDVGGIVEDKNGDPILLSDSFPDIHEYVKREHNTQEV